jgi:hypothetical protein
MSWSNGYPSTCTSTGDYSLQRPQKADERKADEQWGCYLYYIGMETAHANYCRIMQVKLLLLLTTVA